MDVKKEFVLEAMQLNINFTELCTKYGISTKTGYKWKTRFIQEGFSGLNDQSKRPNSSPKQISEEVVLELIRIKNKKPKWGPKKIRAIYEQKHKKETVPSLSTVERILKKAGFVTARKKRRQNTGIRIENRIDATKSNEVWTVDFKGWWYTPTKEKVNPLTVRDDYSKYILSIKALDKGDIPSVKAEFECLFRIYGLPDVIRSDNGPPFASMSSLLGLTKLSVWWMALGIKLDRIEPGSPYQNGSHERMHLDMKNELENQIEGDIRLHQAEFEKWRNEYNKERPHEALGMKTPEQVYTKSNIKYESEIENMEYPGQYRSRKVNDRGFINYKGVRYFIGNPFSGYMLGIKQEKDEEPKVRFGTILIGSLNKESKLLEPEHTLVNKGISSK